MALTTNLREALAAAAWRAELGQGLVEYSLVLVFIAVVAVAALTFLGSDISSALSSIAGAL
jgi:Flp pilus assembly pilin Flp